MKSEQLREPSRAVAKNKMLLFVWLAIYLYSGLVECEPRPNIMKIEGKSMQVTVERTGGFTGIPLKKTVNSGSLSQQEAARLHQMMAAANFFELPSTIPYTPQPDRFQYQITVEQEGKQHSITVGETAVPANLKPLLNWLMTQPAAQPKKN
jgi:hypothetical protein